MSTQQMADTSTSHSDSPPELFDIESANPPSNRSLDFSTFNLPNAGKLINSLRHLGYNNVAAVKDICDNCNDAHASRIAVLVDPVKSGVGSYKITIVDNGDGMDWATLDQSLKLGSETERNEVADLGKFGMGLVTASLSICRRVEVITKQADGPILYSVQDVDEITARDAFVKHIGPAGPSEATLFEKLLGRAEHGTIVVLSHCDQLQNKDHRSFSSRLRKELGQTFRYFLRSGQTEMWVNNDRVLPVDPMLMDEGAQEYSRESYPIEFIDENGETQKEHVEVRLVMLPDFGDTGNTERGFNIRNQGIYLLRNFREIASGEHFDLFTKHNDFNRFRAEIFVTGTLDEVVGVDFTKQKPNFKQGFRDRLNQELKPQIQAIRKQLKHQRVVVEDENNTLFHDEAARQIGQKAHLLVKPKLDVEKRNAREGESRPKSEETGSTKERVNATKTQKKEIALPCRFQTASMTSAGPIWDAEQVGKTLVITWNVDHPFYQRFILDNQDNPSMVTATDFLVYSLCAAELMFSDDDDDVSYEKRQAVLENIRATLSSNMRQLLA